MGRKRPNLDDYYVASYAALRLTWPELLAALEAPILSPGEKLALWSVALFLLAWMTTGPL